MKTVHVLILGLLINCAHINTIEKNKKRPFDNVIFDWTGTFGEVIRLTKKKHYRIDDPEKAMISAINCYLKSLDPHSSFLDSKTYKSILETTSGEFFGIGIVIDATRKPKDRFLMVIDVIPDGPSEKVGLLPYDKIIEIDGKTLEGMTTEEATSKLRGEKNTTVHIKVLRKSKPQPLPFDIVRGVVKEQTSLSFYLKDYDIYYLSLTSFTSNAVQQIKNLLKKSTQNKYRGLILDLRNNSGGLLLSAVNIAGLFLEKGSLVVTQRNKNNEEIARYETTKEPVANNGLPIFILVNNFSASAAEILAGCLKIHSENKADAAKNRQQKKLMVFLVGSTTFGKGSVQEIISVGQNSAARITTSLYHLPDGKTIQGSGIKPDFTIDKLFPEPEQVAWFKKFYGREKALTDYIKPHGSKEETKEEEKKREKKEDKKPKNWSNRARELLAQDNQFLGTITLINILDNARKSTPREVNNRDKAVAYLKKTFAVSGKLNMDEIKA